MTAPNSSQARPLNGESASPQAGKVLSCPFCGGNAQVDANFGREWWVMCDDCCATDGHMSSTAARAIERWNRRAALATASPATPTLTDEQWANAVPMNWEWETDDPLTEADAIYSEYVKTFGKYPDAEMAKTVRKVKEMLFTWWAFHRQTIRAALVAAEDRAVIASAVQAIPAVEAVRWIPVAERLPADHRNVVVWVPFPWHGPTKGNACVASFWHREDGAGKAWHEVDEGVMSEPYEPSHWMPLPPPPVNAGRSIPPATPETKETTK